MSIDLDRLKSLNIDSKCSSPDNNLYDCTHRIQVEYTNTGIEELGTFTGRDIFLLFSELINTGVLNDSHLEEINWKHFQPQKDRIIHDVIKSGSLEHIKALIQSGDIPIEHPSELFKFAIETGDRNTAHQFMKGGFDTNHVEYYKSALKTKNIEMVKLIIYNPLGVQRVLLEMLKDAQEDITKLDIQVFAFLTKTYGDQNIFTPEAIDILISSDTFFEIVKYVEDNTKTVITDEIKRNCVLPKVGIPFTTFWVGNDENNDAKVLYLGKVNALNGKVKNHKITVMFCNQLFGLGVSNVTLS